MHPILFEIFGVGIPSWHTLVMLAGVSAFFYARFALSRLSDDTALASLPTLFLCAYLPGWFGARMLGIFLEEPKRASISEFFTALLDMGPMVFYGGVIAGAIAVILVILVKKLRITRIFDVAVPTVILGLGIGRLGCFLNGCDYGIPVPNSANFWWSYVNPVLGDGISRYPTQLQEATISVSLSAVAALFFVFRPQWILARHGVLGGFLLIATSLNRFVNEFFRGDFRGQFLGTSLSTSQGISLILAGIGLFVLLHGLLAGSNEDDTLV